MFAKEYYNYLQYMDKQDTIDRAETYTDWIEEELMVEWDVHGCPYNND